MTGYTITITDAAWEVDEVKKRFMAAPDATKTNVKSALGL